MNIELAKEKSLIINDDNSVYIELANKYKKIFEQTGSGNAVILLCDGGEKYLNNIY